MLQSVNSLALILSMLWGTYMFQTVSPQAVFAVSAGLLALAVVLSVGTRHHLTSIDFLLDPPHRPKENMC